MKPECPICDRIQHIKNKSNPHFVKELATGYVVIGDTQFYSGYTVFLSKKHVSELHELEKNEREVFLVEMAMVAEAVFRAFTPDKLNYELLGNTDRHLHWHLFPRRASDPSPETAVWAIDSSIRYAEETKPSSVELKLLVQKLSSELSF